MYHPDVWRDGIPSCRTNQDWRANSYCRNAPERCAQKSNPSVRSGGLFPFRASDYVANDHTGVTLSDPSFVCRLGHKDTNESPMSAWSQTTCNSPAARPGITLDAIQSARSRLRSAAKRARLPDIEEQNENGPDNPHKAKMSRPSPPGVFTHRMSLRSDDEGNVAPLPPFFSPQQGKLAANRRFDPKDALRVRLRPAPGVHRSPGGTPRKQGRAQTDTPQSADHGNFLRAALHRRFAAMHGQQMSSPVHSVSSEGSGI